MADSLVVVSKLKSFVRSLVPDMRVGAGYVDELSKAMEEITKSAIRRAQEAGRKTIKEDDL
jgi:histone H3/H4